MDLTFIDRALGSNIPYVTYAVPLFFILIGVELIAALWHGRQAYRLHDSINDLSCGITEQVIGLFLKGLLFLGYLETYAYATRAGITLIDVHAYSAGGKWLLALVLFLGVDCAYYWFHRVAHEYNAPWAGHVVHHSSEEYNLAVALRQGTFQGLFSWVFYLPLALVGFPPPWFAAVSSFDTLYQFWIHTRLIGKLGPLEWVLNTPSHHRVHHARNPKYLDKNYAGVLIIWDRIFGTFHAEDEEPVYGLVKPLNSWNPLWANLHVWHDLFHDAWLAPHWSDKLRIWFMPPGWRPRGLPPNPAPPEVTRLTAIPYQTEISRGLNIYALVHFVVTLTGAFALLAAGKSLAPPQLLIAAVLILWAILDIGGIFEHRPWALHSDLWRLPITAGLVALRLPAGRWSVASLVGLAIATAGSWLYLLSRRHHFETVARDSSRLAGFPAPHQSVGENGPTVSAVSDAAASLERMVDRW